MKLNQTSCCLVSWRRFGLARWDFQYIQQHQQCILHLSLSLSAARQCTNSTLVNSHKPQEHKKYLYLCKYISDLHWMALTLTVWSELIVQVQNSSTPAHCPVWHSRLSEAQPKALEFLQMRALKNHRNIITIYLYYISMLKMAHNI